MNFKNKVIIIIAFCVLVSFGAYFIIREMFSHVEDQLLEKCKIEALVGSKVMSEVMEIVISKNILTEYDIFDTNYIEIIGTNPKKYHTRYDRAFDTFIQKMQDEFLSDPDVDFAVLIDKNGYVPTHNSKYSRPETGDQKKDLMYSRTKRNFSSAPAIKKALQYTGPGTEKLMYYRDTGEVMWMIGCPTIVRGKHWGAFLIGVSLQRIDDIKNQMMILIITVLFVILSLTMLSILAVIPRKLLPTDLEVE